jgi:hypothetical protein
MLLLLLLSFSLIALSELVQQYGTTNWALIARELGTGRHPGVVVKAWVQHLSSTHNPPPRPRSALSLSRSAAAARNGPPAKRQRQGLLRASASVNSFSGAAGGGGDDGLDAAAAAASGSKQWENEGPEGSEYDRQQQQQQVDMLEAGDSDAAAAGGGEDGVEAGGALVPWAAAADQRDELCNQLLQLVAKHGHSWLKISTRMGLTMYQVQVLQGLGLLWGGGGAWTMEGGTRGGERSCGSRILTGIGLTQHQVRILQGSAPFSVFLGGRIKMVHGGGGRYERRGAQLRLQNLNTHWADTAPGEEACRAC